MSHESEWIPLNQAAELLGSVREARAARIELVDEMHAGRLESRARRWIEEGAPSTIEERPLAVDLGDDGFGIPKDFWQRSHAWDETFYVPVVGMQTVADWRLLRFETEFLVDGGRPGWSDRWGDRIIDHGFKTWTWKRVAIGVQVKAALVKELVAAYSVSGGADAIASTKPRAGYSLSDEPLVQRGVEMVLSGHVTSANRAAEILAPEAKGAALESRTARLGRAIRARLNALEN